MKHFLKGIGRHLLPWSISACALVYVFGHAIDWQSIPDASAHANLPLFIMITIFDKIAFFLVWGFLQAEAIRRFIEPVPTREIISVKGASELMRTVNNSLADATFLFGVTQVVKSAGVARVVAISSIPFIAHFGVLLVQATVALPFLSNGYGDHPTVFVAVAISWVIVFVSYLAVRRGYLRRFLDRLGIGAWIDRVNPRQLLPFAGWFALFGVFDVFIQGMAARAFGLQIEWSALFAKIPLMYFAMTLPSLGNFGVREIAWANLFSNYGTTEVLYAFALWTNAIFLLMHVIIGSLFVNRAFRLVREVRAAKAHGEQVPKSTLLRDPIDP